MSMKNRFSRLSVTIYEKLLRRFRARTDIPATGDYLHVPADRAMGDSL